MLLKYPKLPEVKSANRYKLAVWARYLPSPGSAWITADPMVFDVAMAKELVVLTTIRARFEELGGWSVSLSKLVGWDDLPGP
jgi:hypothetical protein